MVYRGRYDECRKASWVGFLVAVLLLILGITAEAIIRARFTGWYSPYVGTLAFSAVAACLVYLLQFIRAQRTR